MSFSTDMLTGILTEYCKCKKSNSFLVNEC